VPYKPQEMRRVLRPARTLYSASWALPRVARPARALSSTSWALPPVDQSKLTPELVRQFNNDGAVVVRDAFTGWVEALRDAAEANLAHPGPLCDEHAAAQGTGGRFHDDQFLWLRHAPFEEFVLRSGAGALAARAMHSRTAHIFYDQLFVKEPGTAAPTPWHNDTSYWHTQGAQICSLWVALDEVPRKRGLAYVRGSHTWGLLHRITNFSGGDHSEKNTYADGEQGALPSVPDVDAKVRAGEYDLLSWDMRAGDVLLFYSAMMHGAPGNPSESAHRRRGYATRWCGDDVVFDERPGTMHTGWKAAGYDCGLAPGEPIGCRLHPNCA
jgi:ectoine hydroxylase-related dioxygenase (phytanoyl-CoA dioxygenase family)